MEVLIKAVYSEKTPYLYNNIKNKLIVRDINKINDNILRIIGNFAFAYCSSLTSVSFSNCTTIEYDAFAYCSSLTSVSFPNCTSIGSYAFWYCSSLTSVYLLASSVCTLQSTTAFYSTPMSNSTYTGSFGSIFVPASLLSQYKSATNWATYSDRITAFTG